MSGNQIATDRTAAEMTRMLTPQNIAGQQIPPENESFGARLRRLRVTRRFSQMHIAATLGVSVPAVSAWEKNRTRPRHGRIEALGQMLGVSVAELLGNMAHPLSHDILAESRAQIARAVGTTPDKVRILIEF